MAGLAETDTGCVTCVCCGTPDAVSPVEIRPHRVFVCAGCYAGLLRSPRPAAGPARSPGRR